MYFLPILSSLSFLYVHSTYRLSISLIPGPYYSNATNM